MVAANLPPQPGRRGADLALVVMIRSDAPPLERAPIPQGRAGRDTPPGRSLLERAGEWLSAPDSARATGVDDSGTGTATNRRAGEAEGDQARVVDRTRRGSLKRGPDPLRAKGPRRALSVADLLRRHPLLHVDVAAPGVYVRLIDPVSGLPGARRRNVGVGAIGIRRGVVRGIRIVRVRRSEDVHTNERTTV